MPKIQSERSIIKIELERIPGGEVEVYEELLAADMEKMMQNNGQQQSILFALSLLIKSWNLTDDNDVLLPITTDNIGKLSIKDVNLIASKVNLDLGSEKKA